MIGEKLNVVGLINVHIAIADDKVYVLEANQEHQNCSTGFQGM
jgi:hypothetical protein